MTKRKTQLMPTSEAAARREAGRKARREAEGEWPTRDTTPAKAFAFRRFDEPGMTVTFKEVIR
jgi:hypothetical protein